MTLAALTASCATTPPPSPATSAAPAGAERAATDGLLAETIAAKLNAYPTYYFRHVDVKVDRGVAELSGYVWSADALYGARRIARSVPGITQVLTTRLELERNGRANGVSR
jgi:osmotically-inducible protein OsmY